MNTLIVGKSITGLSLNAAAHLANAAPGLTTTVIKDPSDAVAVDTESIG